MGGQPAGPRQTLRWATRDGLALAVVTGLFALIFALPWIVADPIDATSVLFIVPVALLAAQVGWRGGLIATVIAFGLAVAGAATHHLPYRTWAMTPRLVAFVVAGLGVGLLADRLERMAEERRQLQVSSEDATQRGEQADLLQRLTSALSRAATLEQVAEAFAGQGVRLLGGSDGEVYLIDRDVTTVRAHDRSVHRRDGPPDVPHPGDDRHDASSGASHPDNGPRAIAGKARDPGEGGHQPGSRAHPQDRGPNDDGANGVGANGDGADGDGADGMTGNEHGAHGDTAHAPRLLLVGPSTRSTGDHSATARACSIPLSAPALAAEVARSGSAAYLAGHDRAGPPQLETPQPETPRPAARAQGQTRQPQAEQAGPEQAGPEQAGEDRAGGDSPAPRPAATAAAPLITGAGVVGVLTVRFTRPQSFDAGFRNLFTGIADRMADAVQRAQLLEVASADRARAEASERRASLLADVGTVLTSPLRSTARMQRLVNLLVPGLADTATVEVPASGAGYLEVLAATHADPALRQPLLEMRREQAQGLQDPWGLAQVVARGRAELRESWPESTDVQTPVQPSSSVAVPLIARGKVLGGIFLAYVSSGRRYEPADLALAQLIAGRAALALDNAQLYEQQLEVATKLQHALLPGVLPSIEGVHASARYRPGTASLDVGGDWYDVITLPSQRVGIVLGDVVGRGVAAAATMGQLRSAVAAIAPYCSGPAEVLQRLDSFSTPVSGAVMATVAYADYEPATGRLRYACAGHPPPLLIDEDGEVRFLQGGRGIPLGMGAGQPWLAAEVTVQQRATLICYSDGLVERRGTDIDARLAELADAARDLAGRPLSDLCDDLLARMLDTMPLGDDVALLCLSLERVPAKVFRHTMRADGTELVRLRAALREWAEEVGLTRTESSDLVLATDEACTNALEHAYLQDRGGEASVAVRGEVGLDRVVTIQVTDSGRWREHAHGVAHRGRGLALIRSIMTSVHIETSAAGTTVTMRMPRLEQALIPSPGRPISALPPQGGSR